MVTWNKGSARRGGLTPYDSIFRFGARVIAISHITETFAFWFLSLSDSRPFRSLRHRLFRALPDVLAPNTTLRWARLPGGIRLRVDVRDWCGITYIEPKAIEPVTVQYLLGHLRPGDCFADVGANFGYMGLVAAERIGPMGKVYCFEPNPRLLSLLEESISENGLEGRVLALGLAVAEVDSPSRDFFLSQNPANSGLSSLAPDSEHRVAGWMGSNPPIQIRTTTLDQFRRAREISRFDAIKIDVEGAEELVFLGMSEILKESKPRFIICETNLRSVVSSLAQQAGYSARMLEPFSADGSWGNVVFEVQAETR